ncbi:type I restriction-modification system subunit M N-terminal domain-containing protein [Candidatus Thiodubiliella endoseptemdiera]|uniref:type I restriction-modification system subunit M N-terminal domain-containing protein n=1 Tax=Candidatus Thiodubiliella endoseptemdiera TaxID=2738886 RepID=UPI0034DFBFAA
MTNITSIVKSIQNIMRQDKGVNSDAQRIEQLGWMIFLKIFDDKDKELELIQNNYTSLIPAELKWKSNAG